LLAILLSMAVALGLVRMFTAANGAGADSLMGRVLLAQAAIPQIAAEENDLVLFFGSSMVQAGFSPREFDRRLAEMGVSTTSFNFGFGGLNPIFQEYVSRRIAEGFTAENRRLKLVLIEFNPFQTTITRRNGAVAARLSLNARLKRLRCSTNTTSSHRRIFEWTGTGWIELLRPISKISILTLSWLTRS